MFKALKSYFSRCSIKGTVKIDIFDKDGNLKSTTGWLRNTITNAGKAEMANHAGDVSSPVAFTYLAVGSSSAAESATHTALTTEISASGLSRAAATVSRITTTVTNDTVQLVKTWTATGAVTVEEVGIFNAASAGIMLGRKLTGTKTLANGETLQATYKVQMT